MRLCREVASRLVYEYFLVVEKVQTHGLIRIHARDEKIDALLREEQGEGVAYTRHFNQSEDFFLKLAEPLEVPSFSIHHDIRRSDPSPQYLITLRELVGRLKRLIPDILRDVQYLFDPAEVLRPAFFRLFRLNDQLYLFHLKIDLVFRPQQHEVITRGTNDTTPVYRTDQLIIDANVIPLRGLEGAEHNPTVLFVEELISETWIGETGRGYFVQGIWIDSDLTKFFTKLMIPRGKRLYPYFPFNSKFRTVCLAPLDLEAGARRRAIPFLHRARDFLKPHLEMIQQVLREKEFSEELPLFQELKERVPPEMEKFWEPLSMKVYLNEEDMKEFQVVLQE